MSSAVRTAAQAERARFWSLSSTRTALRQLVGLPGRRLVDDVHFLALADVTWTESYSPLFEDKYPYRLGRPVTAIRHAPIDRVATGQPRTLMIHAANDEYCDFTDAERFRVMSGAVGNDVRFVPVPNATHIFGFYDRPGQAIMRTAIEDALAHWGWLHRPCLHVWAGR